MIRDFIRKKGIEIFLIVLELLIQILHEVGHFVGAVLDGITAKFLMD